MFLGNESPKPARGDHYRFGPPFWTIASILSLAINLFLIIALLVVWVNLQTLGISLFALP